MEPLVAGQLGKSLSCVGQRVAAAHVGQHQDDVWILPADLPDLGDIGRTGEASGLRDVERHPGPPPIEQLQLMGREEVEDARFEVPVPRRRVVADECIVHLYAERVGQVQLARHALGRPLRPDHGQAIPPALGARLLEARVAPLDVEVQEGEPECQAGDLAPGNTIRWQRSASAAPIGSATSLTQYWRRRSSVISSTRKRGSLTWVWASKTRGGTQDSKCRCQNARSTSVYCQTWQSGIGSIKAALRGIVPASGRRRRRSRRARRCGSPARTPPSVWPGRPPARPSPGQGLRRPGADGRLIDGRDEEAGHVGDHLRRDAAGGRAAAEQQPVDRIWAVGEPADVPRQLAREPLDSRAEQVKGPVGQSDPGDPAPVLSPGTDRRSVAAPASPTRCGQKTSPSLPGRTASSAGPSPRAKAAGPRNCAAHWIAEPPLTMESNCPKSPGTGCGQTIACRVTGVPRRVRWATMAQAVPAPEREVPLADRARRRARPRTGRGWPGKRGFRPAAPWPRPRRRGAFPREDRPATARAMPVQRMPRR